MLERPLHRIGWFCVDRFEQMLRTQVAVRLSGIAMMLLALVFSCSVNSAQTALLEALKIRDFAQVEALVESGADVNVSFADGKTPLMVVGKRGMASLVEKMLKAGARVNAANNNGGTALMFSAITGDVRTVSLMLDAGAEVNAVGANLWGALMVAAVKGHSEVVAALMQRNADPNLVDVYGWTPLMRAASRNRVATARLLIAAPRARIDHRDDDGATALHRAAEEGHLQMVELLVAKGADVDALDARGRTPAVRAELAKHPQVVARLSSR